MSQQTVLRFCISLRETLSTSIAFRVINKSGKVAVVQDFNRVLALLPCYLSKGRLKRDFLDIYLTKFFGVRKSKNTSGMRIIVFWKCSKLNTNSEHAKKNSEEVFRFWENSIWTCCNELHLLRREYVSSEVNGLRNSPKNLHIT